MSSRSDSGDELRLKTCEERDRECSAACGEEDQEPLELGRIFSLRGALAGERKGEVGRSEERERETCGAEIFWVELQLDGDDKTRRTPPERTI